MTDRLHIACLSQAHVWDVLRIVAQDYRLTDRPTRDQWQEWACPGRARGMLALVALDQRSVVGVAAYGLGPKHIWLGTLAVNVNLRRRGIGTYMLGALKSILGEHAQTSIVAQLRETNVQGQQFLKANGFVCVQQFRGNFDDTGEDEYTLRFDLRSANPWHPANRVGHLLRVEE